MLKGRLAKKKGNIGIRELEDHFKSVFQVEEGLVGEEIEEYDEIENREENEELTTSISKEEVLRAIYGLQNGKTAGEDRFISELFKLLIQNDNFATTMVRFFNEAWEQEKIPDSWGDWAYLSKC